MAPPRATPTLRRPCPDMEDTSRVSHPQTQRMGRQAPISITWAWDPPAPLHLGQRSTGTVSPSTLPGLGARHIARPRQGLAPRNPAPRAGQGRAGQDFQKRQGLL